MATVTAPVWLLVVLAVLAACGLVGIFLAVAEVAGRVRDWWRDGALERWWPRREDLADEDEGSWETSCPVRDDGIHCDHWYDGAACCACNDNAPESLELPPERTWEQMTSRQLPVVGPTQEGWTSWPTHSLQVISSGNLGPRQERAVPGWAAEIWRAYAALGLEGTGFTRAMARQVRELTP